MAKKRLSRAARVRGMSLNRYLVTTAEEAANQAPVSGLGRELERMAVDGMALVALDSIRARARASGRDKMSDTDIVAAVRRARRDRVKRR
jgi:hypothetical protein